MWYATSLELMSSKLDMRPAEGASCSGKGLWGEKQDKIALNVSFHLLYLKFLSGNLKIIETKNISS